MPTHPRGISRRDLIVSAAASGLAALAAPMINRGRFRLFAQSAVYSARPIALMERSLVIDMLSPMTLNFPLQAKWNKDPESFTAAGFEKFERSRINVIHPAVGLGGPNAYDSATQFFAGLNAFLAGNDERFMRIDSPGDFARQDVEESRGHSRPPKRRALSAAPRRGCLPWYRPARRSAHVQQPQPDRQRLH